MSAEMYRQAMRVFEEIVALDHGGRERAVDALRDPELLKVVRGLLLADADGSGALKTGVGPQLLARDIDEQTSGEIPNCIGSYRIIDEIGAGGMGRVFEAEQASPKRPVALKIIHPSLVSERSRAWFRGEADAMGALIHPGIPQVYELGEADGIMFIAMERVRGVALMQAAKALSVRDRVRLMVQICDAVVYAHSRGLVHRDLKPANIMVTPEGVPKVLDFGLAGMLGGEVQDVVVGTVAYLAPEQLAGPSAPDMRADVYALGVMLHEVLRDDLPFDRPTLAAIRASGVRPAPKRLDADRADLAGDLTCVVDRATAVDPDDRYLSALALVDDLRRWLEIRPVRARNGGTLYTAGLFVRRNSVVVFALTAVFLGLLGVAVVSSYSARLAHESAVEQRRLREVAEEQRIIAADEQAVSAAQATFIEDVFVRANPRSGDGKTTLWEVTDAAVLELDSGTLKDQPEAQAAMRLLIAEALLHQGKTDASLRLLQQVAQAYDDGAVRKSSVVADAYHGLSVLERVGNEDLAAAEVAIDKAIAVTVELELADNLPQVLHGKAALLLEQGRTVEAQALFERAVRLELPFVEGGEKPVTFLTNSQNQLALTHMYLGEIDTAERLFRDTYRRDLDAYGPDHIEVAMDLEWLSRIALWRGHALEAVRMMRRAESINVANYPKQASPVRDSRVVLAQALLDAGELDEANEVLRRAVVDRYNDAGPRGYSVTLLVELSELRARQGRAAEALRLGEIAVGDLGPDRTDRHRASAPPPIWREVWRWPGRESTNGRPLICGWRATCRQLGLDRSITWQFELVGPCRWVNRRGGDAD